MKVTVERLTPWSLALALARNTMGVNTAIDNLIKYVIY